MSALDTLLSPSLARLVKRVMPKGAQRRFVTTLAEAEATAGTNDKVILLGDAVFITVDTKPDLPPDFIAVTPVFAFGEAKKVKRFVNKDIAQVLLDKPTSFAMDAYIGWGRRQKRDVTLVIGGMVKPRGTRVELVVLEKGAVREITERELPDIDSKQFTDILRAIVQEFSARYQITKTVVADPLCARMKPVDFAVAIGARPFVGALSFPMRAFLNSGVKIERKNVRINQKSLWMIALAAAGLSLAFCSWSISTAYSGLQEASQRFDSAATLPSLKKTGGISNEMLARMEQRHAFLTTVAPQKKQAVMLRKLAQAVASVPQMSIRSITILPNIFQETAPPAVNGAPSPVPGAPAAASADLVVPGTPMATIEVAYPADDNEAVVQGRSVAATLSALSGYPMRIDQQGILPVEGKSGIRRWRIDIPYESGLTR